MPRGYEKQAGFEGAEKDGSWFGVLRGGVFRGVEGYMFVESRLWKKFLDAFIFTWHVCSPHSKLWLRWTGEDLWGGTGGTVNLEGQDFWVGSPQLG